MVWEADSLDSLAPLVREHAAHLVIADALTFGSCGADVVRELRAAAGGYVPLLLTAAAYHLEDKARALALGADGFLGKPVRWPELLGQVRSLLRTKRLYDDLERAKQDLEKLVAHRDRLTHMIVHDLRSPLTGVVGTMEYVLEDEGSRLDATARDLLVLSVDSGQTLLGMVNDLLDVSKMSEVGIPLDIAPVAVRELAEAALGQLARFAADKDTELRNEVPEGLPLVPADRGKLQRVLVNLVSNAVKFTPARGVVRVTAHMDEPAGTMAIAVTDTGMGIPKKDRERIFDLFAQVDDRGPEQRQGTGLGLTFCKMVAEAHGGRIDVDSEEGKGSTFTITLPVGRHD
jgi:two-component system, sensor histidine kinase and response regulator